MTEPYWTKISSVSPNQIAFRGVPVEDLIRSATFGETAILLLTGERCTPASARMIEAILVAVSDHSLIGPSTMAARYAASARVALSSAVAAGICAIGPAHGGAIEACCHGMMVALPAGMSEGSPEPRNDDLRASAERYVHGFSDVGRRVPGFGHPLHTTDPRIAALFALAAELGLAGKWIGLLRVIEQVLSEVHGRHIPVNVDGAVAALLLEMRIDPRIGNAVFLLGRAAGICAHVHEELTEGEPFKTPHWTDIHEAK